MRECNDLLNGRMAGKFLLEKFLQALSHAVDTSYSRNDPKFITDSGSTVRSPVALEESWLCSRLYLSQIRLIRIFHKTFKACHKVRMVNQFSFRNR